MCLTLTPSSRSVRRHPRPAPAPAPTDRSVGVLKAEDGKLHRQRDYDEAHDNAGQPEYEAVLDLIQDRHEVLVGALRDVLSRLETGSQEVDGAQDEQASCGDATGGVAAAVLVGQGVDVVEQYDKAEEYDTEHAYECVVDERVE